MYIGHAADDQPDPADLVRILRRRGWASGGLVIAFVLEWINPTPAVGSIAHYIMIPFVIFLGLDLLRGIVKTAYRKVRRKIVIIDLRG